MSARPVRYGFSTGAGCSSGVGFSMGGGYSGGYGGDYENDYGGNTYGGRTGFSYGSRGMASASMYGPRMSVIRAAARAALRGGRGGWM